LHPDECWGIGPFEERLAKLQLQFESLGEAAQPLEQD
jgi:hypothetical protein